MHLPTGPLLLGLSLSILGPSQLEASPTAHQMESPPRESQLNGVVPDPDSTTHVGIHPGGGGLYLKDGDVHARLMGYLQPTLAVFPRTPDRRDAPGAFSIRRARLDLLVELYDEFTFFVELDGAPTTRTALVEGWINWRLHGEGVQFRAGKFIGRFSAENGRSSRAIDTVERFMALNSMFLLPALDTQTGVMLHGTGLAGGWLDYSLGIYNGNGSANANIPENNGSKEIQLKVALTLRPDLQVAGALDWSREEEQVLQLADLGFNTYTSVPVEGIRRGVGGDLRWEGEQGTSIRAEALSFRFHQAMEDPSPGARGEPPAPDRRIGLHGGFVQPAHFVRGGPQEGVQLLARGEWVRLNGISDEGVDTLLALTLGANIFPNANTRAQLNAVLTHSNGPSSARGFDSARWSPLLLAQLQFKL
jgi:hypothetical protein